MSMALHNHPNFFAQTKGGTTMRNHWSSPWSTLASASWRGSLRLTGITTAAVITASHLIRALIITIIVFCPRRGIVAVSGGGWGRVDYSRSSCIFGVSSLLLTHLFFIGVVEDDDLVITGGPRTARLSSPKSIWVNSKSREVAAMRSTSSEDEDKSIIGAFPEGPPAQTPASKSGTKRSPTEILVVVET
jgi:hypothetical protein